MSRNITFETAQIMHKLQLSTSLHSEILAATKFDLVSDRIYQHILQPIYFYIVAITCDPIITSILFVCCWSERDEERERHTAHEC